MHPTDDDTGASMEMPRYKSHKEVWALKIKAIEPDSATPGAGSCIITPEEKGYARFRVDEAYCRKHNPQVGGYYVVYKDGYKSFSPASAFEEGYILVSGDHYLKGTADPSEPRPL